jgi:hypothetical protein
MPLLAGGGSENDRIDALVSQGPGWTQGEAVPQRARFLQQASQKVQIFISFILLFLIKLKKTRRRLLIMCVIDVSRRAIGLTCVPRTAIRNTIT